MRLWVAPLLVASAVLAPAQSLFMISPARQVEVGLEAAQKLRQKEKVLRPSDPRVQMLRRVGTKLLEAADTKGMPWKFSFDVIESPSLNAFAIVGGPVFFYTGLLEKMKTEDELAGVLGHEIAHVLRQHSARQNADALRRELGLSILLGLTNANQEAVIAASAANMVLLDRPFSRRHETEADDDGFVLMAKAGYNPQGLADFFRTLGKQSGSRSPEWLSTHPSDNRRVQRIEDRIAKEGKTYPAQRPLRW